MTIDEETEYLQEIDGDIPFGQCCSCGEVASLPNLVMLDVRGPESAGGKGWGCVPCGLPADGAMAAICEVCLPEGTYKVPAVILACTGYVGEAGRISRDLLEEPWRHDPSCHPGEL